MHICVNIKRCTYIINITSYWRIQNSGWQSGTTAQGAGGSVSQVEAVPVSAMTCQEIGGRCFPVCVCVRERQRERGRGEGRERERVSE